MKQRMTLSVLVILSLAVGVAFGSPMLYNGLRMNFSELPEGPKANFAVDIVFADFNVQERNSAVSSGGIPLSTLSYSVVLNVTNNADVGATVSTIQFAAAKDILVGTAPLGGFSATSGDTAIAENGSAPVAGVWLDGVWINKTWIPEGAMTPKPDGSFIPFADIPFNGTYGEGYWMDGVQLKQSFVNTTVTSISMYTNGTWVDVTGRIKVEEEQPLVAAIGTITDHIVHFMTKDQNGGTDKTAIPKNNEVSSYVWSGSDGISNYWAPHQSRLITITATREVGGNIIEQLQSGNIALFVQVNNSINDSSVNGAYVDTSSSMQRIKHVQMQPEGNRYTYVG